MKMKKYRLKNGITIIFDKNSSKSVAIEIMFKVGSNDENKQIAGISHFLEHMLFEGTKKRKDSREIANEIEKYGAEFNAYTSGTRTAFFIKIINKERYKLFRLLSKPDWLLRNYKKKHYKKPIKHNEIKENVISTNSKRIKK